MFCGLNLTLSEDINGYWYWNLTNGSTVYCDYCPQCEASFAPDPDIGGLGVITAFVLTAWITLVAAAINAFYPTMETYQRFRLWLPQRHIPTAQQTPFKPRARKEKLEQFTDRTLLALWDLQLVTGMAILVAGLAQWSTITFYHRAIVVNLSYLTLDSFWATRASGYHTSRQRIRTMCIFITLVLNATFSAWQVYSEQQDWDLFTDGMCYRSHDYFSPQSGWLWVAGISMYALTLLAEFFVKLHTPRNKKMKKLADVVVDGLKAYGKRCVALGDVMLAAFKGFQTSTTWTERLLAAVAFAIVGLGLLILSVPLFLAWCFVQFWAVWSAGRGFQAVEVVFYIGFTAWNTFDLIDLKISNSALLTSSESSWGFGQVLPLALLLMLVFNLFDAAKETYEKRPSNLEAMGLDENIDGATLTSSTINT